MGWIINQWAPQWSSTYVVYTSLIRDIWIRARSNYIMPHNFGHPIVVFTIFVSPFHFIISIYLWILNGLARCLVQLGRRYSGHRVWFYSLPVNWLRLCGKRVGSGQYGWNRRMCHMSDSKSKPDLYLKWVRISKPAPAMGWFGLTRLDLYVWSTRSQLPEKELKMLVFFSRTWKSIKIYKLFPSPHSLQIHLALPFYIVIHFSTITNYSNPPSFSPSFSPKPYDMNPYLVLSHTPKS